MRQRVSELDGEEVIRDNEWVRQWDNQWVSKWDNQWVSKWDSEWVR